MLFIADHAGRQRRNVTRCDVAHTGGGLLEQAAVALKNQKLLGVLSP
jgi:hypothetical protein